MYNTILHSNALKPDHYRDYVSSDSSSNLKTAGFFDIFSGWIKAPQSFGIQSGVTEEIRSPDTEATEASRSNLATSQFNRTS